MKSRESLILESYYGILAIKIPSTLEIKTEIDYRIEVRAYDFTLDFNLFITREDIHELLMVMKCEHSHNGVTYKSQLPLIVKENINEQE